MNNRRMKLCRASVEVFRFIVNELQEVAELLPNERSNKMGNYYGRITTPVANRSEEHTSELQSLRRPRMPSSA